MDDHTIKNRIHDIKNRISQIKKSINNVKTDSKPFPNGGNLKINRYRECDVRVIFVDICEFTKFCESVSEEKEKGMIIRTFHEGILDIFNLFKIKNVDIQGDGIFGATDKDNNNVFDCAGVINGYLKSFWLKKIAKNKLEYKISVVSKKELILIVGRKHSRKLLYCGGAVNIAKKINEKLDKKNCIVLNDEFKKGLDKNHELKEVECEDEIISKCWQSNYEKWN